MFYCVTPYQKVKKKKTIVVKKEPISLNIININSKVALFFNCFKLGKFSH